jgi:hypothetical protein
MGLAGCGQFAQMAGVVASEVLLRHQPVMDRATTEPGRIPNSLIAPR